jgi:hypothetical protein
MATKTAWTESAWQDVLTFRQADERKEIRLVVARH